MDWIYAGLTRAGCFRCLLFNIPVCSDATPDGATIKSSGINYCSSTTFHPPPLLKDGHPCCPPLVDGNAPSPSANNALQAAAMAQAQAGFAIQSCENLAKAQARADRWTRDLKIRQVKDEFKTPADKKVNFAETLFITNVLIISYLLGHGLSH